MSKLNWHFNNSISHLEFYIDMASTSKTTSLHQTVTGYMHNVTPLRHGVKRPYFEGVLQQRHKISKIMVFKVELHSKFQTIERDR